MVRTSTLGLPCIGQEGELLKMIKECRDGNLDYAKLDVLGKKIRQENWKLQIAHDIDIIPSNDFTFYDHVLDTSVLLGNIPRRYYWEGGMVSKEIYFAMIFGQQWEKFDIQPMNKEKWYGTAYEYMIPEFFDPVDCVYSDNKSVLHFLEARNSFKNLQTRPSLMGPMTYLSLGQIIEEDRDEIKNKLVILPDIINVYKELFQNFIRLGVSEVEFYEPCLTEDLDEQYLSAFKDCYKLFHLLAGDKIKIHLTASAGNVSHNLEDILSIGFASVHINCIGDNYLDEALALLPGKTSLSLGLVASKDLWVNDLDHSISIAEKVCKKIGKDRTIIAPCSSLFLCPYSAANEKNVPEKIKGCLSFTVEKVKELSIIKKALNDGRKSVSEELRANKEQIAKLNNLFTGLNVEFKNKAEGFKTYKRSSYKERKKIQPINELFPDLPFVMFSSMPKKMASIKKLDRLLSKVIKFQEQMDVDVLSPCEVDRDNDFNYFANLLDGVWTAENSYIKFNGSSSYNPAFVYDKIKRSANSDSYLDILKMALEITKKPLKHSVLGPISFANFVHYPCILDWDSVCSVYGEIVRQQIAEIEKLNVHFISINEPLFLKTLPKGKEGISLEVEKLSRKFKDITSIANDITKICLSLVDYRFEDCLEILADADADILFLSVSRTQWSVLESLIGYKYPTDIGFGLFDISSSRISTKAEIGTKIKSLLRALDENQIYLSTDHRCDGEKWDNFVASMKVIMEVINDSRQRL